MVGPACLSRFVKRRRKVNMSALTNEQIERLSPEQKADLAKLELGRAAKRERLLKQARGSEVLLFVQGAGLLLGLGVAVYGRVAWPILLCLGAMAVVVAFGIGSASRRIDALLALHQADDEDGSA